MLLLHYNLSLARLEGQICTHTPATFGNSVGVVIISKEFLIKNIINTYVDIEVFIDGLIHY